MRDLAHVAQRWLEGLYADPMLTSASIACRGPKDARSVARFGTRSFFPNADAHEALHETDQLLQRIAVPTGTNTISAPRSREHRHWLGGNEHFSGNSVDVYS